MENPQDSNSPDVLETTTLSLVLFNDPVTSFQEVIVALIQVMKWDVLQAENAAMITHNKGKYRLKSGDYMELEPLKYGLEDKGLTVEIQ